MAANGLTPLPPFPFFSYYCNMIRKKIKRLDFASSSLKHIFFIQISDSPGRFDSEEMERFMREVQRSLMIPLDNFDNIPSVEDVQERG